MPRRDNTGLVRRPGLHPQHPNPFINGQPPVRPAHYNKVSLGGLYPWNLVMRKPAWCVVGTCPDSDHTKHPTGRWATKDKVKRHLLTHHANDVLEDTGRQTFRILCQDVRTNVRSRGDGSFFIVGRENVDIAVPAALAANYQAFAPVAMNQLVQPFQPAQQYQAPQPGFAQAPFVTQGMNQMTQRPSPYGQATSINDFQQMNDGMNLDLFGDHSAGLDFGTVNNPIDLSHLDPYDQPAPAYNNALGLRLGNTVSSPQTVAHNNCLDFPMHQFGHDDQAVNQSAFGYEMDGTDFTQQAYGSDQNTIGFSQLSSPVNNSFGSNANEQAYASHHSNLGLSQQFSPVSDNSFDVGLGECVFTEEAIARAAIELGMNGIATRKVVGFDDDNFCVENTNTGFNPEPLDDFEQHVAGFVNDHSRQSAVADFNNGANSYQIPLTANYFDFDGTVVNEAAVLAALAAGPQIHFIDAEVTESVNQLPELQVDPEKAAALQPEVLGPQEEEDDLDAAMNEGFDDLFSNREAIQLLAQRASNAANDGLDFANAGVATPISSQDMHQGPAAPTDFDDLFGDDSATFLD